MDQSERRKAFVLRLPNSTLAQATAYSKAEGISLNHLISIAVAEHLTRLEMKSRDDMSSINFGTKLFPTPAKPTKRS